jgi:hypothetical protein
MAIEWLEPVRKSKYANNGTTSPEKRLTQRKHDMKKKYGLTLDEVDQLKQGDCEICGQRSKRMVIDHEHGTIGVYRGLLCQQCNVRLGWFEKYHMAIDGYLQKSKE